MGSLLEAGKAIIDPGATSTVGSVDALTHIDNINAEHGLSSDIQVDPSERPSFRFGNNGRTVCLSTAQLPVPLHGGVNEAPSTTFGTANPHSVPNQGSDRFVSTGSTHATCRFELLSKVEH